MSVYLYVRPIRTHEPLDRFTSNFDEELVRTTGMISAWFVKFYSSTGKAGFPHASIIKKLCYAKNGILSFWVVFTSNCFYLLFLWLNWFSEFVQKFY